MALKNRLRKIRKDAQMTLETLSGISGVGISTISDIENGEHIPRVDTALMIANSLGLKVDDIFYLKEKEGRDRETSSAHKRKEKENDFYG